MSECLDWAGCLAIVLQDTMALVRIVNTAKSGPEETSARLYHGFQKLADTCPQYNQFISSVREHVTSLAPEARYVAAPVSPAAARDPSHVPSAASPTMQLPALARSMSDLGGGGEQLEPGRDTRDSEAVTSEVTSTKSVAPIPVRRTEVEVATENCSSEVGSSEDDDAGCVVM